MFSENKCRSRQRYSQAVHYHLDLLRDTVLCVRDFRRACPKNQRPFQNPFLFVPLPQDALKPPLLYRVLIVSFAERQECHQQSHLWNFRVHQ